MASNESTASAAVTDEHSSELAVDEHHVNRDVDAMPEKPENVTTTDKHAERTPKEVETSEEAGSVASSHEDLTKDTADEEKAMEPPEEKKEDAVAKRSKGKIAVIMLALCLAVFLAALDVTIITTALPTISEAFHSEAGYTWIGSAFLLANAASIPSWGKVSDIFGRKPMLLVANVIFMAGSLIAALSYSIGMLIAARAIQGVGGGGLIILANIVIGDLFSLKNRGAFYGVIGGVWAIASAMGPILGGVFTQDVTWRWCFYINLPLDGIAFFILLFFLDIKTPRTPLIEGLKAIDWIGSITIVGGTLMFLFGIQYGGVSFPWDSVTVICLLVFGVLTWAIFGFWEWKFARYPIMPMGIFSSRSKVATLGVVFFHGFVFISGSYYLPLYFQAVRGSHPLMSGVELLPTAISLAIGSIGTGIFVKKTGLFLPPIYFGMLLMTVGYGLYIDLDAHSSWGKVIGFQVVGGLGTGPLFQAPIIALQAHIHPRDIGTATATLGFVRQLATSTSVVVGQVVFQNQMKKKAGTLAKALGPKLAKQFGGGNAGAETKLIDALPPQERNVVRVAFANSLQPMWIMYTAFAGAGLLTAFLIRRKVLSAKHEETKTGLEAEKENAAARQAEKDAKRASRMSEATPPRTPRSKPVDVEKAESNKYTLPSPVTPRSPLTSRSLPSVGRDVKGVDSRDFKRESRDVKQDTAVEVPPPRRPRMSHGSSDYANDMPPKYQPRAESNRLSRGSAEFAPQRRPRADSNPTEHPPRRPRTNSNRMSRESADFAIERSSRRTRTDSNQMSRKSADFAIGPPLRRPRTNSNRMSRDSPDLPRHHQRRESNRMSRESSDYPRSRRRRHSHSSSSSFIQSRQSAALNGLYQGPGQQRSASTSHGWGVESVL